MKNEMKVPKTPLIPKEVSLPDPPLKADELIDFLERSYEQTVNTLFQLVDETLPTLLLLQQALGVEGSERLVMHLKDRSVDYCSAGEAAENILEKLCLPLYEARDVIDEEAGKVTSVLTRYREALKPWNCKLR